MSKIPTKEECIAILTRAGCSKDVVRHCTVVAERALKIGKCMSANLKLIEAGALLHDIGRSKTHGIRHAVEGARIAIELNLSPELVRIIECHMGGGITKDESAKLGLPPKDYIPETLEEKIVCIADKLVDDFKKGKISDEVEKLRKKNLNIAAERVMTLYKELSEICGVELDKI